MRLPYFIRRSAVSLSGRATRCRGETGCTCRGWNRRPLRSVLANRCPVAPPATEGEFYGTSMPVLTGPEESDKEAVRQGKPWVPRVGFVIASSYAQDSVAGLWLNVWPEVSDCPRDAGEARAWILSNADRLQFNPGTRRYELR